jgi:hypothetical protein
MMRAAAFGFVGAGKFSRPSIKILLIVWLLVRFFTNKFITFAVFVTTYLLGHYQKQNLVIPGHHGIQ